MNFKRMGVAAAGVILLAASTIFGQDAGRRLDGTANRLDRSPVGATAGGLTAGRVTLSNATGQVTDDAGLTYNRTTDTLTVANGAVVASNVTASGLATPGSITVTPTLTQVGSITTVAGSALVDGDYFTVKYDGGTVPIEFDLSPGDGTTGGRIPLLFTAGDSADLIRDNVILALNAAAPTKLTASSGGAATVALVLDTPGAVGDTNTENVGDGAFAVTGFADPTAATTYTYKLVARLADGSTTEAGAASTTAAGHASLSAANYNALSWSAVTGAASYDVYRTVGGATQGKILSAAAVTALNDTGLAGGGETAPTVDGTGTVTADAVDIASAGRLNFSTDVGLARAAAGVLKVTDGSTGYGKLVLSDGSTSAPSIAFQSSSNSGLFYNANGLQVIHGTALRTLFSPTAPYPVISGAFALSSTANFLAPDIFLSAGAAPATLQLGAADSATPVAQTLQAQGATGTDKTPNAVWTLKGSRGTGTGEGSGYQIQTSLPLPTTGTGTTANTFYDRFRIVGTRKALTESSATPIVDIAMPNNSAVGCVVEYVIEAGDGTDFQGLTGSAYVSGVSKAGTTTGAVGLLGTEVVASSSGTLTNTGTVTTAAGKITFNLNAVSSLTQTVLRVGYHIRCSGPATVTSL